ncbi:MAG: hypothetical protein A3I05_05315 [Deltaproteobacteria bacterium RIFCSPLOWO2_02_FULL_44_10]|nr:MAG: hypothetical protein A3C46_06070 [Deltaproteobacteria bacterium RIFCSPHIGHO2_02_FULL_44_16]OGQ46009.1 MAG: hypothetical protein A3I05_05315 [Deltaproteobacteria bacterium RIFCSPLOWO2_02_FULL_44_10]
MKAIVLAAGTGTRLGTLTQDRPKALVRVAQRELILRVFDFLNHPEITHTTVIVGYGEPVFRRFLQQHAPDVEIISNPDFMQGSILSVMKAFPAMTDDFLLMNVDHIYPQRLFRSLLQQPKGLSAVCDFDRQLGPDDMKVKKDKEGFLSHIHKQLQTYDGGYIGMTLCDAPSIPHYQHAAEKLLTQKGAQAPVEWILGLLAQQGEKISLCDVSGMSWLEIDDEQDLARAEKILQTEKDFLR